MTDKKLFSIVVPVYQNAGNLDETISILLDLKNRLSGLDIEIVLVDDGSTDGSFDIMRKYQEQNKDVISIVKLTKNFGQNPAIYAGLHAAQGDAIGVISADLQDPPELFIAMLERWKCGTKLVIGERKGREESAGKSVFSRLYWKLVKSYAVKNFPTGGFDFCVIDKQIAKEVKLINEKNSHIFVLIFSLGHPYEILLYDKKMRTSGKSQYTISKKLKLFVDTFVAFSDMPIRAISFFGLVVSAGSFIFALYFAVLKIFKGTIYTGWTSLAVLISLFGGLILLTLGILGEYLWRLLEETRKRPQYVVESFLSRRRE